MMPLQPDVSVPGRGPTGTGDPGKALGVPLDTSAYSFAHVADWAGRKDGAA